MAWDGANTRTTDDYSPPAEHKGVPGTRIDALSPNSVIQIFYQREGDDIGRIETLKAYAFARRRDIALRTNSVDVLNRSIMSDFGPIDLARGFGAVALRAVGPLRRAILREGILPATRPFPAVSPR